MSVDDAFVKWIAMCISELPTIDMLEKDTPIWIMGDAYRKSIGKTQEELPDKMICVAQATQS